MMPEPFSPRVLPYPHTYLKSVLAILAMDHGIAEKAQLAKFLIFQKLLKCKTPADRTAGA